MPPVPNLGLAEAHAGGIMHRDIKAANIYLCRRALEFDVVKVLDFGLVRRLAAPTPAPDVGGQLTQPDLVPGTPAYLAPELIFGEEADARADIYALGCVGFWLLTGRLVFPAKTDAAMLLAHAQSPAPAPGSLSPAAPPESLDPLVLDCLAKDPALRPQSAEVLAGAAGCDSLWPTMVGGNRGGLMGGESAGLVAQRHRETQRTLGPRRPG